MLLYMMQFTTNIPYNNIFAQQRNGKPRGKRFRPREDLLSYMKCHAERALKPTCAER